MVSLVRIFNIITKWVVQNLFPRCRPRCQPICGPSWNCTPFFVLRQPRAGRYAKGAPCGAMDASRPRTPLEHAGGRVPKAAPTPPPAPKKARPSETRLGSLSRNEIAGLQESFRALIDDAGDSGAVSRITDDEAQATKPAARTSFPEAALGPGFLTLDAASPPFGGGGAPRRRWSPTAAARRDRQSPTNGERPRSDREAKRSPRRSARSR